MKNIIFLIILASCVLDQPITPKPLCDNIDHFNYPKESISKIYEYSDKLESAHVLDKSPSEDVLIGVYWDIFLFKNIKGDQIFAIKFCCDGANSVWVFYGDRYPNRLIPDYKGAEYAGPLGAYEVKDPAYFFKKKLEIGGTIDSKYFITQRGIKLGMSSSEIIKIYGPPYSKEVLSKNPNITRYKWEIFGTYEAGQDPKIPKGRVCQNIEFGIDYHIDFKETKLSDKAIIIHIEDHVP